MWPSKDEMKNSVPTDPHTHQHSLQEEGAELTHTPGRPTCHLPTRRSQAHRCKAASTGNPSSLVLPAAPCTGPPMGAPPTALTTSRSGSRVEGQVLKGGTAAELDKSRPRRLHHTRGMSRGRPVGRSDCYSSIPANAKPAPALGLPPFGL